MLRKLFIGFVVVISFSFFLPAQSHSHWNTLSKIVSPERLASLNSYPVEIVIKFNDEARPETFRAWLNRKNITDRFEEIDGGMRALVGSEDGLRIRVKGNHGQGPKINLLKTFIKGPKRKKDIDVRAFWVKVVAMETIGPEGGLVGYNGMTIKIPEGALQDSKEIIITSEQDTGDFSDLPVWMTLLGNQYKITGDGDSHIEFEKMVEITIPFEEGLMLALSDDNGNISFLSLHDIDESNQTMTFLTMQFSSVAKIKANIDKDNPLADVELDFDFWDDLLIFNPGEYCYGISTFTSWYHNEFGSNNDLFNHWPKSTREYIAEEAQEILSGGSPYSWDSIVQYLLNAQSLLGSGDLNVFAHIYYELSEKEYLPTLSIAYWYQGKLTFHSVLVWKIERNSDGDYKAYVIDSNESFSWNGKTDDEAYCIFNVDTQRFEDVDYENYTIKFFGTTSNHWWWNEMEDIYNSFASIEIPTRTITIDGMSGDWSGIDPILNDEQGDSICEEGTDITKYYLAKDNNYLYWRVDTQSGNFTFEERILVLLFYESGAPNGPYPNGITVNVTDYNEAFVAARYTNNEWTVLYGGPEYGVVGQVAEGKILLTEFNPFTIEYINTYYWRGPDADPQCDEVSVGFSGGFP